MSKQREREILVSVTADKIIDAILRDTDTQYPVNVTREGVIGEYHSCTADELIHMQKYMIHEPVRSVRRKNGKTYLDIGNDGAFLPVKAAEGEPLLQRFLNKDNHNMKLDAFEAQAYYHAVRNLGQ